jgi:two-component system phosphate regulon sensor histidine kinase PhoR
MRREFIANISHELKTPLAAIKGYAETVELAIKDDPDAAVHFMTQIHTQCLRLERLIADMMQLARAQAGRSHLNIVPISMRDAIIESMKSYRPVAEARSVNLEFREPESTPLVWSDSEAMLTISNNLVGNAIRYTPQGGSVTVSCRDAGKFWALVVEDTGVGISEADQKRIFERFYRVGKSRGTGDGGTGIGLSIVKNLTLTLGGEVRVASRPGEGSKFEILLPKAEASSAARRPTAHSTPSQSHAVAPPSGSVPRS